MATETYILDVARIRADFPILQREIRPGVRLIYLDSTATAQKPLAVIEAMDRYYRWSNANIHRGVHTLGEEATALYEAARQRVARFIRARKAREIVFTRNTTEAINLVAYAWGRSQLRTGDLIVLTEMEHHSNLVPWQILAAEKNIRLEFVPVTEAGYLDLETYEHLLDQSPRLVAFTHMSNVLGTINPVREMAEKAHRAGALVLVDGAQSVPHLRVDVQALGVDFLAFSAHKMLGPTGIGALYAREDLLEQMPPFLGGGDMIKKVMLRTFTPNDIPYKFEAGTPAIAEAVGLEAAVAYLEEVGMEAIEAHERGLIAYALERLATVPGLKIYGPVADHRGGVVSFSMEGVHPHDVAQLLDREGIAVRAGHHCAMPLHEKLGLTATTRASFYLYNTYEEVDRLVEALHKVRAIFE
ncbi:cysteine desulfurase [uncultured Thermanaerothrix sp.]|uniref:aminotransferase class V-fold PLP-dependent enzyme n=1 Tax=uncultured Thermanaerothrix sp. TaxID=1195149 RepID=UPI002617F66B|nr:cysteine desulfurase [uncultured Thermanaerothrix sp.]